MLAAAAPRVGGRARTAIPAAAFSGGGGHFNRDAGGPTFASRNHRFFDTRGLVTRAPSRRLVHGGGASGGAVSGTAAVLDPDQAASLDEDGGAAAAGRKVVGIVRGQIKSARAGGEGASLKFLRIRGVGGVGARLSEKEKTAPALADGEDAQADAATAATVTATATAAPPSPSSNAAAAAAEGEYPYTFPAAPDFVILRSLPDFAEGISDVASLVRSKVKQLRAKTRAATLLQTHPPLPVVGTFEELLRFANIASLNSAKDEDIEAFFRRTGEEVTVLDMASVKQRLFVATDHRRRLHTISFRGTTNLTNVVQNIRLNSNPVKASGKLASVGRSLSGAFLGLRSSSSSSSSSASPSRASSSSGDDACGSGSFDEDDDDDACLNVVWDAAEAEAARARSTGCTDHLPMHRGYRIVARECRDAIAPLLQPGYAVQLTGHSLGGAVAVALALLYKAAGKDVAKVVTFGAPKLGPKETRDAAEGLNILRVVQKDDIIPLLPMSRPFVRKPYVHLGEGIMLDNDVPGRYAKLTREWGTAGILWRQRAHTGYAAAGASLGEAANGGGGVEEITGDGAIADDAGQDVLVSADDADKADSVDAMRVDAAGAPVGSGGGEGGGEEGGASAVRAGRWQRAKARLSSLRAALRESIVTRAAGVSTMTPSTTAGAGAEKIVVQVRTAGENLRGASRGDERESWRDGISAAAAPLTLRAPPMSETEWAAEVAEWAHAPHEDAGTAELAPFDDVEGELFVRLAETEGGATAAAAAAATEWEKAASRVAAAASFFSSSSATASTDGPAASSPAATTTSRSTPEAPPATAVSPVEASNVVSPGASSVLSVELASHATHQAGPTIFERLWQLRRQPSQERVDRLECHRMKRYIAAVQAAIDAGPVQSSLAAIYSGGKEGHEDDVGLDMKGAGVGDEDDEGPGERGLSSWLAWSR